MLFFIAANARITANIVQNFFIYEALLIPFEITALTTVLGYWSDNIPSWSIPLACIVCDYQFTSIVSC